MNNNIFITAVLVSTICTNAAAAQDQIELDPIVVNAGIDKVASDVPQSISVLNQEKLDDIQAGTVGDVLDTLPGISGVGSSSILGQSFNIRGVGAGLDAAESSIITLVDGEELYYESYRQGSLFTEPELLKRVEVLRGPGYSTLYGSGALGGVILLETKDPADFLNGGDTFAVRQKLSYETNPDTVQLITILAFKPDEKLDALLAFSYRDVGESEDANGNRLIRTNAGIANVLAKIEYNTAPNRYAFSYNQFKADGDDQDFNQLNGPQAGLSPGFAGWGVGDIKTVTQVAKLEYGYNPEDNQYLDFIATVSYTNSLKDVSQGTVAAEPIPASLLGERAYGLWKLKFENVANISSVSNEHYLTIGAAVSEQDRTSLPSSSAQAEGKTRTYEIYALSEFSPTERLTINTGVRIDHQKISPSASVTTTSQSSSDTAIEPQISAIYTLNDNWNIFGSVARVNRLPTVDEIYDTFGTGGAVNLTLRPEKGVNYEIGASFSGEGLFHPEDQADIKITAFYADITDKINRGVINIPNPPGAPTVVSGFSNQEKAKIKGIEIEGGYAFGKFSGSVGVTIIDGEDEGGVILDTLANNSIKLGLSYRATNNFRFGMTSTFAKSRRQSNNYTRSGYGVHNFYAVYSPSKGALKGSELRVGIDNLVDKQYTPATFLSQPAEGRNFKISLAKTF